MHTVSFFKKVLIILRKAQNMLISGKGCSIPLRLNVKHDEDVVFLDIQGTPRHHFVKVFEVWDLLISRRIFIDWIHPILGMIEYP